MASQSSRPNLPDEREECKVTGTCLQYRAEDYVATKNFFQCVSACINLASRIGMKENNRGLTVFTELQV